MNLQSVVDMATVHKFIQRDLNMYKICAKFVARVLSDKHPDNQQLDIDGHQNYPHSPNSSNFVPQLGRQCLEAAIEKMKEAVASTVQ